MRAPPGPRVAAVAAVALVVATAACGPIRATPQDGGRPGVLVAAGGGTIGDDVRARVLALSGGDEAVVLVVPQASGAAEEAGAAARADWEKAGAGEVSVLDLRDRGAAEAAVARATLIWMTGGDQVRLVRTLEDAGIAAAIRRRHEAGATVGGTSAGAAALSKAMMSGDADLDRIAAGRTQIVPGLGLWPEAIVDQHVLRRGRLPRLIAAVLDRPGTHVGVGVDEGTATIVHQDGTLEVVGESSVVVVDARGAAVPARAAGRPAAATGVRLHILTAGMRLKPDP